MPKSYYKLDLYTRSEISKAGHFLECVYTWKCDQSKSLNDLGLIHLMSDTLGYDNFMFYSSQIAALIQLCNRHKVKHKLARYQVRTILDIYGVTSDMDKPQIEALVKEKVLDFKNNQS